MRNMKRSAAAILCIALLLVSVPFSVSAEPEIYTLPVFETSDIHGYLVDTGFDSASLYQYRLAYIADAVDDARNGNPATTVLLDGGDIYQGNVISNLQDGLPLSAAFDAMAYDAVALGNHEFDWGIEVTTDPDGTMPDYTVGTQSYCNEIPIVCSNLYEAGTSNRVDFTKDYVILEKTATAAGNSLAVKIAVIGYAPNYSSSILSSRISPYTIRAGLSPVETLAKQLKTSGKADAVILLAHEDGAEIAGALSSSTAIDLVCGGHSHYGQAGTAQTAYIQAAAKAASYGFAELKFTASKQVSVTGQKLMPVTANASLLHDIPQNAPNLSAPVLDISHLAVSGVEEALTAKLGYITTSVNGDSIGGSDMSSTAGNWMTDLANRATDSKVSFTNAGGIRTSFYLSNGKYTVTKGDIFTIAPFGNHLYVYEVTYADLLNILIWAIGRGKGLKIRMSGIDCYYTSSNVTALVEDGVCIYKDGTWANGVSSRRLRISANEFIATSSGTPFYSMSELDASLVDNEAFIRVLELEGKEHDGLLTVDKKAHLIKGSYNGALNNDVFYTISTSCSEGGSITPTARVREGDSFTVEFAPQEGRQVKELLVDGHARTVPEDLCITFTNISTDHTVKVSFEEVPDPCAGFADIPADSWYHAAAAYVISKGIMGSTQTDALTFEPTTACTRAMVVSMLYRMTDAPEPVYTARFPDVPDGAWYTGAVIWAAEVGVVSGYDNGYFGAEDKVTREQMAVILMGYAQRIAGHNTSARADLAAFPDAAKVRWSKDAVQWAVAEELISGKEIGGSILLDPQGNATRAEVASILMRFCTFYQQ